VKNPVLFPSPSPTIEETYLLTSKSHQTEKTATGSLGRKEKDEKEGTKSIVCLLSASTLRSLSMCPTQWCTDMYHGDT
jgi:hypothetical protein